MKIIADKNIPFLRGVAELYGDVEYLSGSDFTNERIKDADALIVRTVARLDEAMLHGTNVKLICSATIGYDHIDTDYCDAHTIEWTNAPGCNSGSVMQYVVASLIVLSRKYNFDLQKKTIGIVGVGNVGAKVAKACQLLGMKVLLNDPLRQKNEGGNFFVSLDQIRDKADIITFHTPLVKEGEFKTYHLVDKQFFANLNKKPFIINSARGGIVDTGSIKEALRNKQIAGAVIDCWENEPDIDLEYMNRIDIATPHIAGYSADGKANATRMSLEALANFLHLDKTPLKTIKPPEPIDSLIDLSDFAGSANPIYDAILRTYNPMGDFARLKESPSSFKSLRNDYPLRREFAAYRLANGTEIDMELWQQLCRI